MSYIKENIGGTVLLPLACCSITGCSGCPARGGGASNSYTQTANTTEREVGNNGGAS